MVKLYKAVKSDPEMSKGLYIRKDKPGVIFSCRRRKDIPVKVERRG